MISVMMNDFTVKSTGHHTTSHPYPLGRGVQAGNQAPEIDMASDGTLGLFLSGEGSTLWQCGANYKLGCKMVAV